MTGPLAAEVFYDARKFSRSGAAPRRLQKTLFGVGGVQGLDGEAHAVRKDLFVSLTEPAHAARLATLIAHAWLAAAGRWASMERVVLYDEVRMLLTRAVCTWAGVPLLDAAIEQRADQLTSLFEGAGAVGPRHWRSRISRTRAEAWLAAIVSEARSERLAMAEGSPLRRVAELRDANNQLLDPRIAAVELLNLLRPTVAVSAYIIFAAHALQLNPACRQRLQANDEAYAELFVQEVRRYYPFFPAVMARVRKDFEWQGYHFPEGIRVLLDLYGTNHDSRTWEAPEEFRPERFRGWDGSPFNFVPQGGGDLVAGHRCPGERIAIELMKVALDMLTRRLEYDVPDQDLRLQRRRVPALPASRFIIANVRRRQ